MIKRLAAAATLLAVSAAPAFAHLDPAQHGSLMAGVSHPLFGLDHILAMVAVGLWAALLAQSEDRRALWLVPAAFRRHHVPRLRRSAFRPATALRRAGHPRLGRRHRPASRGRARRPDQPCDGHGRLLRLLPRPCAWGRTRFGRRPQLRRRLRALHRALHAAGIALGLGLGRLFGGRAGRFAARLAGGATALGGLWLAVAG